MILQDTPLADSSVNSSGTFRRLLRYVWPYRLGFMVAAFGMLGYALVDVFFVSQLESFIDVGIDGKDTDYLKYAPLFIIGIFVLRGVFNFIASYCLNWVGTHIVQELRQQLFRHYMQLPVSFHDKHSTGELISRVTYDTEQIKQATSKALIVLLREGVFVAGLLAVMFWNSWQLSSVFLVIAPVIAIIVRQAHATALLARQNHYPAHGFHLPVQFPDHVLYDNAVNHHR